MVQKLKARKWKEIWGRAFQQNAVEFLEFANSGREGGASYVKDMGT